MGGGRVLRGGSSAELALRRLGFCKWRWRCRAAGIASIDGQFCNLYPNKLLHMALASLLLAMSAQYYLSIDNAKKKV